MSPFDHTLNPTSPFASLETSRLLPRLLTPFVPLGDSFARQMSFDLCNERTLFLRCDFSFMNRGRLWCSRRILFRHWT